jgi:hypothetical protein
MNSLRRLGVVVTAVAFVVVLGAALPAAAKAPRGSRANPYPHGTPVRLSSGWVIRVGKALPAAWSVIHKENQFNKPPATGRTFFMVTLIATYRGSKASDNLSDSDFKSVGRSNVSYTTFEDSCGVIPNELPSKDVFQGGTIKGNVCWQVKKSDVRSLLMYWEDVLGEHAKFFALQ